MKAGRSTLLFALVLGVSSSAVADLLVTPPRAILDDSVRVLPMVVRHRGKSPETYRLRASYFRMKDDGTIEPVDDTKAHVRSAIPLLRFSPKVITLAPEMEQVVRVIVAKTQGLPDGEYRAHLNFVPDSGEEISPGVAGAPRKIAMQLALKVGFAIPVFFRHGKTESKVELRSPQLIGGAGGKTKLSFELLSLGNVCPHGDVEVQFTPKDGEKVPVGSSLGVTSYLAKRTVTIPLDAPDGLALRDGTLSVEFKAPADQGGQLLATVEQGL